MKLTVEREGGLIVDIKKQDACIAYKNSVLVHYLFVTCELYPDETIYATFADKKSDGEYENLTIPMVMSKEESFIEDGKTFFICKTKVANQIVTTAGAKGVSLSILIPRGTAPETYKQVTSGRIDFEVTESLAGTDYESIPESNIPEMQAKIDAALAAAQQAETDAAMASAAAEVSKSAAEAAREAAKTYSHSFSKSGWVKAGDRYCLTVTQSQHGFVDPYVEKMLVQYTDEDGPHSSEVDCDGKTLTITKAVKVYVDVPLADYENYDGKIIIKGV